eukprot:g10311.t1
MFHSSHPLTVVVLALERTADSPTLSQFQRIYTQLRLADLPYGWGALLPSLEAVAAVATNTPTPTQSLAYDPAAFLLESPASTLSFDRQQERAGSRPDRPPVAPARPGPDGELALQLESFVTFGESTPDDVVRFHVATPNEDETPPQTRCAHATLLPFAPCRCPAAAISALSLPTTSPAAAHYWRCCCPTTACLALPLPHLPFWLCCCPAAFSGAGACLTTAFLALPEASLLPLPGDA